MKDSFSGGAGAARSRQMCVPLAIVALICLAIPGRAAADKDPVPPGAAALVVGTGGAGATAEPTVDTLCKSAVALALVEPERARGFIKRARLAGWLPEVHFRVYRRFARTEGLTFGDPGTGAGAITPVDIDAVDDVRYEWRASWDLSRMVFNPDELQAHFEALRMADVRRDIQSLVIKLYFERRRLMSEAKGSPGDPVASPAASGSSITEKRLLRVGEIEAQLDALSGGAFFVGGTSGRQAASPP